MSGALNIIQNVFRILYFVSLIIAFYLSLKKCFLRDGKSKVKMFFLSLLTNPYIVFWVTAYTLIVVVSVCLYLSRPNELLDKNLGSNLILGVIYSSWVVMICSLMFVITVILVSLLVGKMLRAHNKLLVVFVYLMFSVIFAFYSDRTSFNTNYSHDVETKLFILGVINTIACVIVVWLMYCFVINPLSKLTNKKRKINGKTFLIPPALFLLVYYVFDVYTLETGSADANIVFQLLSGMFLLLFIWAFYVIINNIRATDDALSAKEEIKALSIEVMEALANTIDAKDTYTNGHSVRVAEYSRMIAEKMGLPEEMCDNIYNMGLLHDIGKIGVPNEIINKPSRLTDDEYDVIKTHPEMGYNILSKIKSKPELVKGARWHHERYDGKGYPDKKSGEDIPLEARIIAVADGYDAMTSNRSYRAYMPQDVVRAEIEKNIGTQFDPEAAKYMLMIIDEDKDYKLHERTE